MLLFDWPTAENFLRYSRDMVTASAAAPQLAELIELLAEHTDAETSTCSPIAPAPRSAARGSPSSAREPPRRRRARLGEIYHAAPDADFRGFVDDMEDYARRAAG